MAWMMSWEHAVGTHMAVVWAGSEEFAMVVVMAQAWKPAADSHCR